MAVPTSSDLDSVSEQEIPNALVLSTTEPAIRKRSRTGCLTCKQRRIRCDEKHPACLKCTSTGRRCDGYAEVHTKKKSQSQPMVLMIVTDFERATYDATTNIHLQYFFDVSAPALTNHRTSTFWNATVLQACHQFPCIRDLAIAVASLERSLRSQACTSSISRNDPAVHVVHYGKALRKLSADQDLSVILIGCLMLVLLEDLRRNPYAALTHIRAGRQLLASNASMHVDRHLFDQLLAAFKALYEHQPELASNDVRINGVYRGDTGPRPPSHSRTFIVDQTCASFRSLEHASQVLQSLRQLCVNPPPFPQPLSRFHAIPGLTERLNEWLERFNLFIQLLSDGQQAANKIEIHTLRAYHLILRISSCCTAISTETCYDYYVQDLEGLVKKLSILREIGSKNLATLAFFVACKYRDVAGRRRAIGLLRDESNGWRGALLADVAEVVVDVEENGNEDAVTFEDIPEYHRVRPRIILSSTQFNGREVLHLTRAPFGIDAPKVEVEIPVTSSAAASHLDAESKNVVLAAAINLNYFSEIEIEPDDVSTSTPGNPQPTYVGIDQQ